MRASFVFHLETKVLESGGRVEKLIAQVSWSPVLSCQIITIKRTKDLNYFILCAMNLFNTQVSQFIQSRITEINVLLHDILIYWDAPVYN